LVPKQPRYERCPALELLSNSLCVPRTKKFGDPGLAYQKWPNVTSALATSV